MSKFPRQGIKLNFYSTESTFPIKLLSIVGVLCLFSYATAFAQPSNDVCSGAINIATPNDARLSTSSVSGSTITATTAGAPVDCGADVVNTGAAGIWYTFTGNPNILYRISTCDASTDFDTELSIFTGSCGALTCLTGNDNDNNACLGVESPLNATTHVLNSVSTTYYIFISGEGSATGNFSIILTSLGSPPSNDLCITATELTVPLDGSTSVGGNTFGATNLDDPPSCGTAVNSTTTPGLWYTFTGTAGREYQVSTCDANTLFNTEVSVFSGDCNGLVCVEGNDNSPYCADNNNQSIVFFNSGATTQYFVYVTGSTNSAGAFSLTITDLGTGVGSNDVCVFADELTVPLGGSVSTAGTTVGATTMFSPPDCGTDVDNSDSPGVWYSFNALKNRSYEISTCDASTNFDTELSLFAGTCTNLVCIDGNDDYAPCTINGSLSTIFLNPSSDDQFFVYVTGEASTGAFDLTITDLGPLPFNSLCADAELLEIPIPGTSVTTNGTTLNGNSIDAPADCGFDVRNADANGVWFTFTGTGNTLYQISTCSNNTDFDTEISVYTGDCNTLSCVDGNDTSPTEDCSNELQSSLRINSSTTTEYYIYVNGQAGASGNFDLSISDLGMPVANDFCEGAIEVSIPDGETNIDVMGSTMNATAVNAPTACTGLRAFVDNRDAPGVWYSFTGSGGTLYQFRACDASGGLPDRDLEFSVYTGDCNDLNCLISDEADFYCNSYLPLGATQDTTYYIYIKGKEGTEDFTFNITDAGPQAANNECSTAELLTVPMGQGDTLTASFNDAPAIDPSMNCPGTTNGFGSQGLWYTFIGEPGRIYEINANLEPNLVEREFSFNIYTGDCDNLVCADIDRFPCRELFGRGCDIVRVTPTVQTQYYIQPVVILPANNVPSEVRFAVTDVGPIPANEECSTAEVIIVPPGGTGSAMGDNTRTFTDSPLPCQVSSFDFRGDGAREGLWYTFTANTAGALYEITTCDPATELNTAIGVFSGDCSAPVCLDVSDDDATCSFGSTNSTVYVIAPAANTQYYVYVSSGNGSVGDERFFPDRGPFKLNITEILNVPPNDICISAEELIVPAGGSVTTMGSNVDATTSAFPGNCEPEVDNTDGPGIWYTFTGTPGNLYGVTTCGANTNFDTEISLYQQGSGLTCNDLSCVRSATNLDRFTSATNDDDPNCNLGTGTQSSTAFFEADANGVYYVYVKGNGGTTGDFDLTVTDYGTFNLPNTFCDNATNLGSPPINGFVSASGSTTGAFNIGAPEDCGIGVENQSSGGLWYTFTGTGNTLYEITTCNNTTDFDTEISVFTGPCETLNCETGNDNSPSCTIDNSLSIASVLPNTNTQYYVYVKGNSTESGNFELRVNYIGEPTPIELSSFTGLAEPTGNRLRWVSASEQNTAWHIIERSADGVGWAEVGRLPAAGDAPEGRSYELLDSQPLSITYYRLRTLDFDESFSISNIISIDRRGKRTALSILNVYPVPAKDLINVQYQTNEDHETNVLLYDKLGRLIFERRVEHTGGVQQLQLDVSTYPVGTYFLQLIGNEGKVSKRIVKE